MLHHVPARGRRVLQSAVAALVATGLLAACSGGEEDPPEDDTGGGAPDQVTYLTAFGNFGRDAFPYCGVERGIYEDHNIELTIEAGSGTQPNLEQLLGGNAQFVLGDMVGSLVAYGQDTTGWKAVAAILQTDVSTWMTLDPDLQNAQDLEGKTIAMPPGGVITTIFPTYAELAGADFDKIKVESVAPQELAATLAGGNVDAVAQFAYGVGTVRAATGGEKEVFVHPLSDVLTDLYGNALLTTDEIVADNPDLVERFRDATLESLEWALDNPDECAQIQYDAIGGAGPPAEVGAGEIKLMDSYVRVGDTVVGSFDDQRVARMISVLEGSGTVPPGITPEDLIAFDFVPAA
jgi:NitT/TauT family transport system substrate-binding protein